MKKDLEMFKMNKVQMNNINGGARFLCHGFNEFGGGSFDVYVNANSQDEAENAVQSKNPEHSISCKQV